MGEKQLCLSCGERPAKPSAGTVPLCGQCEALAKGQERGVKFDTEREKQA